MIKAKWQNLKLFFSASSVGVLRPELRQQSKTSGSSDM